MIVDIAAAAAGISLPVATLAVLMRMDVKRREAAATVETKPRISYSVYGKVVQGGYWGMRPNGVVGYDAFSFPAGYIAQAVAAWLNEGFDARSLEMVIFEAQQAEQAQKERDAWEREKSYKLAYGYKNTFTYNGHRDRCMCAKCASKRYSY